MPEPMSDERLADIRERNDKRRNWVLNTVDILGSIEHGEKVQDIDELLAEVERLRRCDDQTSVTHELRDRMAADRIKELEAENAKLRKVIADAKAVIEEAPELNMSNYDHDDVDKLNAGMIEAWGILEHLGD